MRSRTLLLVLAAVLAAPAGVQAATVTNGGFESGLAGWTSSPAGSGAFYAYTGTSSPASGHAIAAPAQGTRAATSDQNGPGSQVLHQDLALEAGQRHTLTLRYAWHNRNSSFYVGPSLDHTTTNQQMRIDVVRPGAGLRSTQPADVLATLVATTTSSPTTRGWTTATADLDAFAGQTVRLRVAVVETLFYFQGMVDDVVLTSVASDSTPPDTVIDSGPAAATRATSAAVAFHATEAGSTFACSLDGGPYAPCSSTHSLAGLAEGAHVLRVRATDAAGNEDPTPAEHAWVVDRTDPEVAIARPAAREHVVLGASGPPQLGCTDPARPVASGVATCAPGPFATQLGAHTFTVTATDAAGNTATLTHGYQVDPPRYGDLVAGDDPIAWYRLDDAAGAATLADASGHGHVAAVHGDLALRKAPAIACQTRPARPAACATAGDEPGFSARFPQRDGSAAVNGIAAPPAAYTLEAWVKPADAGDTSIVAHDGAGQLFVRDGRFRFRQVQDTIDGGAVIPGAWQHVAGTWDGAVARLYVNGAEAASSASANKAPSGTGTLRLGYGDQAPWLRGGLDEVAYYDHALSAADVRLRSAVGRYEDVPAPGSGPLLDTRPPAIDLRTPAPGATYAAAKVPALDVACADAEGATTCAATVDGVPVAGGDALPAGVGEHTVRVTAVDGGANTTVVERGYRVTTFAGVVAADAPLAHWRLGEPAGATELADATGARPGRFHNAQQRGETGISGDGDATRAFLGHGGYAAVPAFAAPAHAMSLEAWVKPADGGDMMLASHGDAAQLAILGGRFAVRHMGTGLTSAHGVAAGAWSHVAATWDGEELVLYVDGRFSSRTAATKRPSSASAFLLGFGELAPWLRGALDEVSYYATALSAQRVFEHFLADPPADGPAPPLAVQPVGPAEEPSPVSAPSSAPEPDPGPGGPAISAESSAPAVIAGKPAPKAKAKAKKRKAKARKKAKAKAKRKRR